MIGTFRKLMALLDAAERRRFWLLFCLMLTMGVLNMAGVASILPFLLALSDPEAVRSNPWLAAAYDGLGFEDPQTFMFALGFGVFAVYLTGVGSKALTQYATIRFGAMRTYSIASRMLRSYMRQPYVWFLDRHSADLTKAVLGEVTQVVRGAMIPMLSGISNAILVLAMIALMVLVNPTIAGIAALTLGGSYVLMFLAARRPLLRAGQERFEANRTRFRVAQEALTGIKEVKVLGLEEGYLRRFRDPAMRLADAMTRAGLLNDLPRHLLDALAFGGVILLVLVMMALGDGTLAGVLPTIGVYVLAGSRMSPAMQAVYKSIGQLRFNAPAVDALHADAIAAPPKPPRVTGPPIEVREGLALREVCYSYPTAEREALDAMTLEIPANASVGLVGGTGAGKTTTVDVIMGLLLPDRGALEVDGRPLTDMGELRSWRRSIGYVPQQIFLVDASVSENIAFGVPAGMIDPAAVERAARMAELHDFVTEEMPQGYDTRVGDRGVRLSGGQRQRIGIARALYHDPPVLVLDEATSALDNVTERAVMASVAALGGAKTVVMIAHRLTTVQGCDRIYLLEGGRVAAAGTYDELLDQSEAFREMARGAA